MFKKRRFIVALVAVSGLVVIQAGLLAAPGADSGPFAASSSNRERFMGWTTNGPAVMGVFTNPPPSGLFTNAAGVVYRRPVSKLLPTSKQVFDHFLPESLNHLVWTNFIAHTNGRSTVIWTDRRHPEGWPANAPLLTWNTNCLMWGMKGLTALSPCWELESGIGQIPITALTRRHGYTRGHSMAGDGFHTVYRGKRVWFVTAENEVVQVGVSREVVRTSGSGKGDYTILLFDRDLPASVQPIRVAGQDDVHAKYPDGRGGPHPMFFAEQAGHVSAQVAGFMVPLGKGGDSGSPIMLPMPGELVFFGGGSTSGPCPAIQADMDELCRMGGIDPQSYQMQWFDLATYPAYSLQQGGRTFR